MKILILFALALATTIQAQQPAPCLQLTQAKVDHRVLRRGAATDVKLKFEAGKHNGGPCYVVTESAAVGSHLPVLEIQNAPGVSAKVGVVGALRFDQASVGSATVKAQEISATIILTASSAATLGEHTLAGTVRYKSIDIQGNVSDEALSFDVPIKVEQAKSNTPEFPERHPVWARVLLPFEILALIALLPLVIVAELAGWDTL